jgi:hypothetical protein
MFLFTIFTCCRVTSSSSGCSSAARLMPYQAGSHLTPTSFSSNCRAKTQVKVKVMLRPTVSRPVCLGIKHPSGTYDQISITVRQLLIFLCGALSLTRGRVCRLQLLLALTSVDIFRSDSHGTRDHNLLSQIRDFPFRRLLWLAGLRWRYSTPPPHGREPRAKTVRRSSLYRLDTDHTENTVNNSSHIVIWRQYCREEVFIAPSPSNGRVCRVVP